MLRIIQEFVGNIKIVLIIEIKIKIVSGFRGFMTQGCMMVPSGRQRRNWTGQTSGSLQFSEGIGAVHAGLKGFELL